MKIIFAYILSHAFVVSLYEYIGVVMYLFFLILVISFVTAMMAYYKGRIIGFIMVWFQIPLILGKILVIWRLPLIMRNWLDFSRHINEIILFGFPGSCVTKKKKKKNEIDAFGLAFFLVELISLYSNFLKFYFGEVYSYPL